MGTGLKQGWFESDGDYLKRLRREADEGRIERTTGDGPSQGIFESDDRYEQRIGREADEDTIEHSTGSSPSQGFFESNDRYSSRIEQEANERTIEDVTGSASSQGWFESDDDYRDRIEREADEATIERATGDRPSQGLFESNDDYADRISREADEHDSDNSSSSGSGCFLTTACVEHAGLPDNCRELTTLRQFRDNYLAGLPQGAAMITEYYAVAPVIVARINASPDKTMVLHSVLTEVRRAVGLIEHGHQAAALKLYAAMFQRLRADFGEDRRSFRK